MLRGSGLSILISFALIDLASAQPVIRDTTLPDITEVSSPDSRNFTVTGGTRSQDGHSLFHSFEQFSVPVQGSVVFDEISSETQNIFSRVTGVLPSNINGRIAVQGDASLFLINPNGIVFGEGASLDVRGSFVATTANSVLFEDGIEFRTDAFPAPLLSVTVPTGLQMGRNPGNIRVENTTISGAVDQSIALVGGNITLNRAVLELDAEAVEISGGRVELGSLAENSIARIVRDSNSTQNQWSLDYQNSKAFQNIRLINGSSIYVGNNGGNIQLQGRRIHLSEASEILLLAEGEGDITAGSLIVRASELLRIVGNERQRQRERATGILNEVGGDVSGEEQELRIETPMLQVIDGGQIGANAFDNAQSVALKVFAENSIILDGLSIDERLDTEPSALLARAEESSGANAAGGEIILETESLRMRNGAQISASTRGQGSAGSITIDANSIVLTGRVLDAIDFRVLRTELDFLGRNAPSGLFTGVEPSDSSGDGGNIRIDAEELTIRAGAQITTVAQGNGMGGDLNIDADSILISGAAEGAMFRGDERSGIFVSAEPAFENNQNDSVQTVADAGSLRIEADELRIENRGLISADNFGVGNSGADVVLDLDRLILRSGGQIGAGSFAEPNSSESNPTIGPGGNITINASERINVTGVGRLRNMSDTGWVSVPSAILVEAEGTGEAGNITINDTGELRITVQDGAEITASATGSGAGGNLNIEAERLILDDQAEISAETTSSAGGNITLSIDNLLLLRNNSRISTTAGTRQAGGDGGNIDIEEVNFVAAPTNENSDITADAFEGSGGKVDITAIAILGIEPLSREELSALLDTSDPAELNAEELSTNDITAISQVNPALNGQVTLDTPDLEPERGTTELPFQPVRTEIAQGCVPEARTLGRDSRDVTGFVITGRGGLPTGPADITNAEAVLEDLGDLATDPQHNGDRTISNPAPITAQPLNRLQEAEGLAINQEGRVILTADASSANGRMAQGDRSGNWEPSLTCDASAMVNE